jgi:hypothetical protein
MYCFAGGTGQSVWAWDLRGGQGQALYELSTGNLDVDALVWHEASSSLIASCNGTYRDRWVGDGKHKNGCGVCGSLCVGLGPIGWPGAGSV